MIDEFSLDGTGWARFSDDRKFRYRLSRNLTTRRVAPPCDPMQMFNEDDAAERIGVTVATIRAARLDGRLRSYQVGPRSVRYRGAELDRMALLKITFVMLNPSVADAFKLDPTVSKCCKFARLWGAQVIEVVNLFALRSPDPKVLYAATPTDRGVGLEADDEILAACDGATRVIAAWGNHGELQGRSRIVRSMLTLAGVKLHHLGLTGGGFPLHPLARGKAFIPLTREPVPWEST